ncbi:sterol-binding protein [Parashewanella curva]|uniref:Ubiquinone biosynthesis accessory factor UbiJ n=1 Tax=Parashewanella curva TaxID=2338552 RepID=A0A3L8Q2U6_9GAMM|nr:SCP2 sterol-binding domain-containing protein [Parashewanella curva]RLV61358.1 sterol-binding protein [Parashewanella curva]
MSSHQLALVCVSVVETALAQLAKLNPHLSSEQSKLKGKIIKIQLKQLPFPLFFIGAEQILVMSQFSGEADVTVNADATTLYRLTEGANLTELIKADKLQLDGDLAVLQNFNHYLQQLSFDWGEIMAKVIGDAPAHWLQTGLKQLKHDVTKVMCRTQEHVAELAIEEYKLAPHKIEFIHFQDTLETLENEAEQLAQRIAMLRNHIN